MIIVGDGMAVKEGLRVRMVDSQRQSELLRDALPAFSAPGPLRCCRSERGRERGMAVAAAPQCTRPGVAILTCLELRLRVRVQRDRGPSPPSERMERMSR